MIFARALGDALHKLLETDERVVVMGEDIADPYGGAFKVTRGLTTAFPDRVRTTPVSESALTGLSAGLALRGFRPILEIMFGDFVTLCFDQVANHISKYQAMYNDRATCPVIIRTPSGGGRGYGPTHSQSLEKHFLGVPHLRVVAASVYHDPLATFQDFLSHDSPVLYVEHKLLYPQHVHTEQEPQTGELMYSSGSSNGDLPTIALSAVPREDCTATVFAYGYQALAVAKVVEHLAVEEEIFVELLVPAQISPIDYGPLEESVSITGSLVTVEEGPGGWSWGTQVAEHVSRSLFGKLRRPVEVLASEQTIIPSAKHLENEMLVNPAKIEKAIREAAS